VTNLHKHKHTETHTHTRHSGKVAAYLVQDPRRNPVERPISYFPGTVT